MSKRVQVLLVGLVCFLLGALVVPRLSYVRGQEEKAKTPLWKHGMELRVRKAGEADFNDKTKKYGIEVFRDENNGNLIYISETGSIAVVPAKSPKRSAQRTFAVNPSRPGRNPAPAAQAGKSPRSPRHTQAGRVAGLPVRGRGGVPGRAVFPCPAGGGMAH